MGIIYGLDGKPINGSKLPPQRPQEIITQTQAGAIMISEIDIAIERFNAHNRELGQKMEPKLDPINVDQFAADFKQYAYTEEVQKAQDTFGYAELKLLHVRDGISTPVYSKAISFKKESELGNKNGYFPEMAIDCMGFLLASGLMYNLALLPASLNPITDASKDKEGVQGTGKPKSDKAGKPGTGNARKSGKGNS